MTSKTLSSVTKPEREAQAGESRSRLSYADRGYEVICVCGGIGFPVSGSSKRIVNVGRALMAAGIGFRVLHCAPTPVALNTRRSGVHLGIPFEYTTTLKRPSSRIARIPVYSRALTGLAVHLFQARKARRRTAVYLFVMDGPLVLCAGLLAKAAGIPLVQEMCEWFPTSDMRAFTKWLYRKPIFSLATGVLAISTLIEKRVHEVSQAFNLNLLVHLLPSMVDSQSILDAKARGSAEALPTFLWCGVGYPDDVRFLVRVLALLHREGRPCKLRIVSAAYHAWTPKTVLQYAAEQGVPEGFIEFTGAVDDATLAGLYKSAAALLLPMWDNDKSRTRVPNKLAEYLASGRPVITSGVGDIQIFLQDGQNAYMGTPGSERDFANNMIAVVEDPARAARIGAAGQKTCLDRMDFRYQSERLSAFFVKCIESRR